MHDNWCTYCGREGHRASHCPWRKAMRERWKPVVGFEDRYEVSSTGRVRSVDCVVHVATRWGDTFARLFKGQLLTLQLDADGYWRVGLYRKSKGHRVLVHRLVAQAFIPNPEGHPEVDHVDSDRRNASVKNLQWVARGVNTQLAVSRGRIPRGAAINTAKLNAATVRQIRRRVSDGASYSQLAREFGVSDVAVRLAALGVTWRHV